MVSRAIPADLTDIRPLERRAGESALAGLYEYLREMILDGTLAPGTVISQVELARSLGVSRTPLREALRRLQQEGLIEAEANRRARVNAFDPKDLERIYVGRLLHEPLGVAVTVERLTAEELEAIGTALADMRSAVDTQDHAAWEDAHRRFHHSLVIHASEDLAATIAVFADRADRYRRLYQSAIPRAWDIGDQEHGAIYDACVAGDADEAVHQIARHFARTALALLGTLVPEREPVEIRAALRLMTGASAT